MTFGSTKVGVPTMDVGDGKKKQESVNDRKVPTARVVIKKDTHIRGKQQQTNQNLKKKNENNSPNPPTYDDKG